MTNNQTKSKQRVADHGEVFTAEREVNAMLDLVKHETERIDSRFLEPACGDGNFLVEILRRKLAVVKSRYGKNPPDYEFYAVIAITSIYGVDILQDNVNDCQERLYKIFNDQYTDICKKDANNETRETVRFILERNILCGNALDLKTTDGEPIVFSEWSAVNGFFIKRRDFRLDEMLEGHQSGFMYEMFDWEYDNEIKAYIPKPFRQFEATHYKIIKQAKEIL